QVKSCDAPIARLPLNTPTGVHVAHGVPVTDTLCNATWPEFVSVTVTVTVSPALGFGATDFVVNVVAGFSWSTAVAFWPVDALSNPSSCVPVQSAVAVHWLFFRSATLVT